MIKDNIKSVLRNKANYIYIIVFVIIFLVLNISMNMENIVDKYYNIVLENYIKSLTDSDVIYEEAKKEVNKIGISNLTELSDETRKMIENIKYVKGIETKEVDFGSSDVITLIFVKVDDWKHIEYVQDNLSNQGLSSYWSFDLNEIILENYNRVNKLSRVVKYMIILISICIIGVCCRNILKNEKDNIKLLSIIGYNKNKIKTIVTVQLIVIISIGFILGITISEILLHVVKNNII